MAEQEGVKTTLSPQQLEQLWAEHLKGEFETKDVEETLATMVDDAYVNHMPVNTGGMVKRHCDSSIGMTSFPHGQTI